MSWKRRLVCGFAMLVGLVVLLVLVGTGGFITWYLWAGREIFAGYSAKILASGVFIAERSPESVAGQELAIIPFLRYTVDEDAQTVTAWTFRRYPKTAVYRAGLGSALAHDGDVEALRRQARPDLVAVNDDQEHLPWPRGNAPSGNPRPAGVDADRLAAAVDGFFTPPSRFLKQHTRAVIVVYKDEIVAEQYADGFDANQRFAGWSMTKSVFHALYGIAIKQGLLSLNDTVPFWSDTADPRSEITLDTLLHMRSGLDYTEYDFIPPTAQTTMLFLEPGAGDFALSLPLLHPPGTVKTYASATTNLLSLILRHACADDDLYHALPYRELFWKIGMNSALIEADATGTFVGSSFMYATARDYARFGLLYLHDGVWQGERILPEGWVDHARGGAHWGVRDGDRLFASGFEGQFIAVIPSNQLVIVHLGLDLFENTRTPLVEAVLAAFD